MPKRLLPYNEQKCKQELDTFLAQSLMIFEHMMWHEYGWPIKVTCGFKYRIGFYRQVTLQERLEHMPTPKYKM
jgi:hypothetical protein